MNEQIKIYESLSAPPKEVLKEIVGGRLKGMTDVKPQWRIKVLTETFGLCGIGWKYTVDRQWTEQGANGEMFAFVNISLYVKIDEKWSEPIHGIGGSKLIAKEQSGLYCNDEAFKMSTTDALSFASKHIGVAADVYMGQTTTKYNNETTDNVKKIFPGSTEITEEGQFKEGQEVPKAYWNLTSEEKRKYMPRGCKATKVDGIWKVLKKEE